MKRKKSGGGGGANWMDTYGDMVTLLLCFFVLLYSISSVDESKWLALVRSFNPDAIYELTETSGEEGPAAEDFEGLGLESADIIAEQQEIDEAIEQLYEAMQTYAKQSEIGQNIETIKGDGYVFITFDDAVFFEGERYDLRPQGEQVLADISNILSQSAPFIDEIRVMGHTAQGSANQANNTYRDRFLASNRATIATVYIQQHSTVEAARLVSVGYGQHRPIAPNDTPENRSRNRRVEIIITGRNVMNGMGDSIEQYYSLRAGEASLNGEATQ